MSDMLPARRPGLFVRRSGGELVVVDGSARETAGAPGGAHLVSGAAAQVWACCDGQTTVEQAAVVVGCPPEQVREAVGALSAAGLLAGVPRRTALRGALGVGALAGTAALVTSTALVGAATAASTPPPPPPAPTVLGPGTTTDVAVPATATALVLTVVGGRGSGGGGAGKRATLSTTVPTSSLGSTVTFIVATDGSGRNGGTPYGGSANDISGSGGGGASVVRSETAARLVVTGGGGGGGTDSSSGSAAPASTTSVAAGTVTPGGGGAPSDTPNDGTPGQGGQASQGGSGGPTGTDYTPGAAGTPGTADGQGGNGGYNTANGRRYDGGGGGGGYTGGGGGGGATGAGAGSSYSVAAYTIGPSTATGPSITYQFF